MTTLRLGEVSVEAKDLTIELPRPRGGPWQLVSVAGSLSRGIISGGGSLPPTLEPTPGSSAPFELVVESARAGGTALQGVDKVADRPSASGLYSAVLAARIDWVPAVMTTGVATAANLKVGSRIELTVGGRRLPVEVLALVDSVPTASTPDRAVVLDLPTVLSTADPPTADRRLSSRVLEPTEWWLAPARPLDVEALRTQLPGGSTVALRTQVVEERLANPVNAGMRASMLLVTAAALVLAAVGFAATTAALGRERRRENAVLLALGMPPSRIRRTLEAERVAVVVLTVVVGLVLGVLSALAVVPVLVGGDGRRQVPRVVVDLPWTSLELFAGLVAVVLAVVGVLVLRRVGSDVAAELRRGTRDRAARAAARRPRGVGRPRPRGSARGDPVPRRVRSVAAPAARVRLGPRCVPPARRPRPRDDGLPRRPAELAAGAQDRGIADAVRLAGSAERDLTLRLTPRAIDGVALPSSTTVRTASRPSRTSTRRSPRPWTRARRGSSAPPGTPP